MTITAGGLYMGKATKGGIVGGVKLTTADRNFMTRGERRKAANEKRQAVDREERVGPTPETEAKLIPCPIAEMYRLELIDKPTKDAALELAELYVAVYGAQMPGSRGTGGHHQISNEVAWKHEHRYLPWARKWANVRFRALSSVIDVVVLGIPQPLTVVAAALADYAAICRANPLPAPDKLAMEVL